MNLKFISPAFYAFFAIIQLSTAHATQWTLNSSIARAMSVSPELRQSSAKINARNVDVQTAEMWPDPSIEFKVDNQIGRDEGTGDYGLAEITLSQEIPVSRIKFQKTVAEAQLSAAIHSRSYDTLLLQNRVAKVFYKLQLASANYSLAQDRVKFADKFSKASVSNNNSTVIRYLTPLEKMRLSIIREKAHQTEAATEGELKEILTEFYKLLATDSSESVEVAELLPIKTLPDEQKLISLQNSHPLLSSQQQNLQAATNEIDLARSSSMKDPSISINRLRENFSSGTESVYGIMFNIEIPIHDRKSSAVSKASYNASQQRIELARLKRNLQINLKQSFTHLNHVIEQASEYRKKVLTPATKILNLSKKGFISGELSILSFIDANDTYFESHMQYLDLIYQSWIEIAEINLYSGQVINIDNNLANLTNGGVN